MKRQAAILFALSLLIHACETRTNETVSFELNGLSLDQQALVRAKFQSNTSLTVAEKGGDYEVVVDLDQELGKESFNIRQEGSTIRILAGDPGGALYAAFDLMEQHRFAGSFREIEEKTASPHQAFRAIKFNLPWASYREGEALQLHTETTRSLVFWEAFLDMMVANRFNALTLWNLHPFPYMIRAENFPFACPFTDEELVEWQNLFRGIFKMARDRGIETYIVNWNIFVSKSFQEYYGLPRDRNLSRQNGTLTEEQDAIVRQYTRESVAQVIDEYPNLTGIGLSLGEAMNGMSEIDREEWVLDCIVKGMQMADREARLIHRVPFASGMTNFGQMDKATERLTRQALEKIDQVKEPILVEAKFNWSHGHSTPKLVKVHGGEISDTYWNPLPENYRIAWMVRNEDFFLLRWGLPDFVREHIKLNAHPYVEGYFVGSETYIPARDYLTPSDRLVDWKYAFERQWLFYKIWGRLLYNPQEPDDIFRNEFIYRYGEQGSDLLEAYKLASQTPHHIASSWDGTNDRSLYSEGFITRITHFKKGSFFITLDELINFPTLDPQYLNVNTFVKMLNREEPMGADLITPLVLADSLDVLSEAAMKLIATIEVEENASLAYEVGDIQIWSALATYFADRLRGATAFEQFRLSKEESKREKALTHLEDAVAHWQEVITYSEPLYDPVPALIYIKNQEETHFHWSHYLDDVQADLTYVKEYQP